MPLTFRKMVEDAATRAESLPPEDVERLLRDEPTALVIEVRDREDIETTGMIPGSIAISLGTLAKKACLERPADRRDRRLDDRDRPIVTTCEVGLMAILAASTLRDMGFSRVAYLDGGTQAWKESGFPTVPLDAATGRR
jgi:rhodanese-related sulfurtransferase